MTTVVADVFGFVNTHCDTFVLDTNDCICQTVLMKTLPSGWSLTHWSN